jgi:hypothetical protein
MHKAPPTYNVLDLQRNDVGEVLELGGVGQVFNFGTAVGRVSNPILGDYRESKVKT